MIIGEYILKADDITLNEGRDAVKVLVKNISDRPIQVGSHFHFYEVNKALYFERKLAYLKRLNIPSGTAIRFEPGQERLVELIAYAGSAKAIGFSLK